MITFRWYYRLSLKHNTLIMFIIGIVSNIIRNLPDFLGESFCYWYCCGNTRTVCTQNYDLSHPNFCLYLLERSICNQIISLWCIIFHKFSAFGATWLKNYQKYHLACTKGELVGSVVLYASRHLNHINLLIRLRVVPHALGCWNDEQTASNPFSMCMRRRLNFIFGHLLFKVNWNRVCFRTFAF